MAVSDTWTPGADFATNEVVTATKLNQQVRDDVYVLSLAVDGDTSTTTIKHRHLTGTAAARPAAGEAGRTYYATDTKVLSTDNGTIWDTPVRTVRKTGQQQWSSSTLTNDNHLFVPLAANEVCAFELFLVAFGTTGADVKYAFTVPTGATLKWGGLGLILAAGGVTDLAIGIVEVSGTADTYGLLGAGTKVVTRIQGTVANGANAGNLQLQCAQVVTDAGSPTTVDTNSWLKAHAVA